MNIKLAPVNSKEKAERAVAAKKAEMEASVYWKMAQGEYGQSRIHEGETTLIRYKDELGTLQDIADHAPAVPTVTIMAYNSFAQKDVLKANGFRWDGTDKCWYKVVTVANLDKVLAAIGGTVSDIERRLAGL